MKTLLLFDLDGTLLRTDKTVFKKTAKDRVHVRKVWQHRERQAHQ